MKSIIGVKWVKQTATQHFDVLVHTFIINEINYNAGKVNKDNIFINTSISDTDLRFRSVGASDTGDYICEIKAINPNCLETRIVKLHVWPGNKI